MKDHEEIRNGVFAYVVKDGDNRVLKAVDSKGKEIISVDNYETYSVFDDGSVYYIVNNSTFDTSSYSYHLVSKDGSDKEIVLDEYNTGTDFYASGVVYSSSVYLNFNNGTYGEGGRVLYIEEVNDDAQYAVVYDPYDSNNIVIIPLSDIKNCNNADELVNLFNSKKINFARDLYFKYIGGGLFECRGAISDSNGDTLFTLPDYVTNKSHSIACSNSIIYTYFRGEDSNYYICAFDKSGNRLFDPIKMDNCYFSDYKSCKDGYIFLTGGGFITSDGIVIKPGDDMNNYKDIKFSTNENLFASIENGYICNGRELYNPDGEVVAREAYE